MLRNELTREEYCGYDSAITLQSYLNIAKQHKCSPFEKKVFDTIGKLSKTDNIIFNIKKTKSFLNQLELEKPKKTAKVIFTELGYLKKDETFKEYKLFGFLKKAKSPEDIYVIEKYLKWSELKSLYTTVSSLLNINQNGDYIHDIIDYNFVICNSGTNSINWRFANNLDVILDNCTTLSYNKIEINENSLSEHFNVSNEDVQKFEMVWKESLDREFKQVFGVSKLIVEDNILRKYPNIDDLKFNIVCNKNKVVLPWISDHTINFEVSNEKNIFEQVWNISTLNKCCDTILNIQSNHILCVGNQIYHA